ncbi:MAG: hypothetical protein ACTSXT_01415 [Candidatus Helarchaeota archaeon]
MNNEYVFSDFRVVSLKEWLNLHKNHATDQIIGKGKCGEGFRFIVCRDCKEAYFADKI